MDQLSYHYIDSTNQLEYVTDQVAASNYAEDIDGQNTHNYRYDEIGNLIADDQAMINNIEWNVYGKITNIAKSVNGPSQVGAIDYKYDPSGNRIGKIIWMYDHPAYNARLNWYVRDAQGNVMAVYQSHYKPDWTLDSLTLIEHHMYGSSRLGIINRNHNMDSLKAAPVAASLVGNTYLYQTQRGHKLFELSNHLGNVLVTISDRKNGVDSTADGNIDYYTADVVNANDYYPFGMLMPGRKYSASDQYRYGFNGQEKSNEIKGEANSYTAEFWEYDPRLGRRLNLDPKPIVDISSYACFKANPIWHIDPLGDTSRPIVTIFKAAVRNIPGIGATADLIPENKTGEKIIGAAIGTGEALRDAGIGITNIIQHPLITLDEMRKISTIQGQTNLGLKVAANYFQSKSEDGQDLTNARYVSYGLTMVTITFIGPKAGKNINQFAAESYLKISGKSNTFATVDGFSLRLGANDFIYHKSLFAAKRTPWSTPTSFSSSLDAFNSLGLDYNMTTNFAQMKFSVKNIGFFVKGTAANQNLSLGGGTQLLKTPFSLKYNLKPVPFTNH